MPALAERQQRDRRVLRGRDVPAADETRGHFSHATTGPIRPRSCRVTRRTLRPRVCSVHPGVSSRHTLHLYARTVFIHSLYFYIEIVVTLRFSMYICVCTKKKFYLRTFFSGLLIFYKMATIIRVLSRCRYTPDVYANSANITKKIRHFSHRIRSCTKYAI